MSLIMKVDGHQWRSHLRAVAETAPGIIPVAKGNGYGFGVGRLARRAVWLGVPTLAVGTYDELDEATSRFPGDIVVLTPWRPFLPAAVAALGNSRIIHTVGRFEDLEHLKGHRIVVEVATSMRRHGFNLDQIPDALKAGGIEALSIHLPLPGPANADEFAYLLESVAPHASVRGIREVWVSHLSNDQLRAANNHGLALRPRVGTQLWLGAENAISVEATVLDAHAVNKGDAFGYRRRIARAAGNILVVSGGTAHGIGLEAPAGSLTVRDRAARVARGGLDALGRVRSPFFINDHQVMFAEPPHMQSSMLFVPSEITAPQPGDVVRARVRHTATNFDAVDIW